MNSIPMMTESEIQSSEQKTLALLSDIIEDNPEASRAKIFSIFYNEFRLTHSSNLLDAVIEGNFTRHYRQLKGE